MPTPRTNVPKPLADAYWEQVRRVLQSRHHLTEESAERAVQAYQRALIKAGVRDAVYHTPIEETADGIVTGSYVPNLKPRPATKA